MINKGFFLTNLVFRDKDIKNILMTIWLLKYFDVTIHNIPFIPLSNAIWPNLQKKLNFYNQTILQ